MLRFEKVATPCTAATVDWPARVPLAGLLPISIVMLVLALESVCPYASCTVTTTGLIAAPATADAGWTVKASVMGPRGAKPPESQPASSPISSRAKCVSLLDMGSSQPLPEETAGRRFDRSKCPHAT